MDNRLTVSSFSSLLIFNDLYDLKRDSLYLETDIKIDDEIKNLKLLPSDCHIVRTPHVIILRLLHIFGPFQNNTNDGKDLILIAQCECQPQINVLICIKNFDDHEDDEQQQIEVSFEQLNHLFTLKNFLTIACKNNLSISFVDSSEINCQILSNTLNEIVIIVSKKFHSNLIFHENCEINDIIHLERLSYQSKNAMDLTIVSRNSNNDNDNERESMNESMELLPSHLPSDDDMDTPIVNGEIMDIYANTQSTEANFSNTQSTSNGNHDDHSDELMILETELDDDFIGPNNNNEIEKKIQTIIKEIGKELMEKFNLSRLIRTNFKDDLIEDNKPIELTLLSQLQYPINSVQSYRFVNIVGIVKRYDNNLLLIYDETMDDFEIRTENRGIDYYKTSTDDDNSGNIVCIRQLCLTQNHRNICANSEQIIAIEIYNENDHFIVNDKRKISTEEFKQIIRLYCHQIKELINCKVHNAKNLDNRQYYSGNLIGLCAAKFSSQLSDKLFTDLYLMIPTRTKYPSTMIMNISSIAEQIENMSIRSNRNYYKDESFLQHLLNNNQIIHISVWGNHHRILSSILPLDIVILYNVYIRNDRNGNGFYFYTLSDGFVYGRRLISIKTNTIIDNYIQRLYRTFKGKFLKNLRQKQTDEMAIEIESDLDSSILLRLGSNAKDLIKKMKNGNNGKIFANEQQQELWKFAFIKKNIFNYVKNHRTLFESLVNVDMAKKIDSFVQLIQLSSSSSTSDVNNDEEQSNENLATNLYRISARLINYQFNDKNGIEFINLAHLRQNQMKINCQSKSCDFIASFNSYFLPKAYDFMSLSNDSCNDDEDKQQQKQRLICQKCGETLSAYLFIELYFEDDYGNHLTAMLSSPEIENLIHCTNQQLICSDPESTDILMALQFILKTLCPVRQIATTTKPSTTTTTNNSHQMNINPKCDWIIESTIVKSDNFNYDDYSNLYNRHLFDSNQNVNMDEFSIFYIRSIMIND
ncbi:hypothetical protein DERP_007306 [Dermatophagoides pteronyssinus]|uniref:Uncharacterized protein n=1 Tax=Dermatophagoides pteronyssinus TaxID=6956 RepID=A0ABQ8J443_DERPT|nr:hypothetical protein DERP_007306 [Dermatophagoides pteronyssinus]